MCPSIGWPDLKKKKKRASDKWWVRREGETCWSSKMMGLGSRHSAEVDQGEHKATLPATLVPSVFQPAAQARWVVHSLRPFPHSEPSVWTSLVHRHISAPLCIVIINRVPVLLADSRGVLFCLQLSSQWVRADTHRLCRGQRGFEEREWFYVNDRWTIHTEGKAWLSEKTSGE